MKRPDLAAALAGLVLCALPACGGGGGGGSSTLFADSFDDPSELGASPWAGNATLPNGWVTTNPTKACWWVTANGGTGGTGDHALVGNNEDNLLLHEIDGAQDYTVSANVKYRTNDVYPTDTGSYATWLLARATGTTSYYGCGLYYHAGTNQTRVALTKYWNDGANGAEHAQPFFTGPIELNAYYHVSLSAQGGTITCRASSPTHPEVSTSVVEDGTWGATLTGTRVGIRFIAAVNFHPYFDDFLVEAL